MEDSKILIFDDDAYYTDEHIWVKQDGDEIIVGISDYAQDQLGEIIFVELPETGETFAGDDTFGVVESAKSASELYMPVSGGVILVNEELDEAPEEVNSNPFGNGWMIKVKPDDMSSVKKLLTVEQYKELVSRS